MSHIHRADSEMRRGRPNDSSSSRESSPRRPSKRSFSPTSDDGDLVVPPIPFDDTPPPPERPLLRQPVAFAWSSSTSVVSKPSVIDTYQATLPHPGACTSTFYLPGQAPVVSKKKSGSSRTKKSGGPSKKRRTNAYAEQTGRFRLQAYDPLPSVQPAAQQEDRSSAAFRGVSLSSFTTETSLAPTLPSSYGDEGSTTTLRSPSPIFSASQSTQTRFSLKKPKTTATRTKTSTTGVRTSKKSASIPSGQPSTSTPAASLHVPSYLSIQHASGHYRRDYDTETTSRGSDVAQPPTSSLSHPNSSNAECGTLGLNSGSNVVQSGEKFSMSGQVAESISNARRPTKQQLRMVTLLIQDIRSGVTDHQLAEVKIPLRPTDDPADGFWADARLLSEQLQAGPSRIDGPAKVYTLRGKYRQFFLRVSAGNVDDFISTNLVIQPERTMDVVVEALLPPGQLPLPPQIPRDLRRSSTPGSLSPSPAPEERALHENSRRQRNRSIDSQFLRENSRANSPSVDISAFEPPPGRPSQDCPSNERVNVRLICDSGGESQPDASTPKVSKLLSLPGYRHESPYSDDEPDDIRRLIVNCVDTIIQQDPGWTDFFRAKAAMQPQRVSDVLKQYRFVKQMADQWIGQRLPFRTSKHLIEMNHIIEALKIDDPSFAPMCFETLTLLELYGPNGKRSEDSRVVAMIADTSRPEYNSKPIKRMLHLMRDIEEEWKMKHPGECN